MIDLGGSVSAAATGGSNPGDPLITSSETGYKYTAVDSNSALSIADTYLSSKVTSVADVFIACDNKLSL